ncbi:hypothetical protein BKA00_005821 [Actinomadura coerulea]|uniref:Uncharacterized protein n=1 Tax=Actinomadura coerulea TaxID=46159 RepID=A0A7X0G3Z4_9ACTN|nr:hypothetical protein [Actinomadura coerulea]MBB6398907.1 hypothetical protein [Actinomadura coerulea]GGP98347.1 hypothetical protein GCM10010187_12450 [Actinomadura coerulea]
MTQATTDPAAAAEQLEADARRLMQQAGERRAEAERAEAEQARRRAEATDRFYAEQRTAYPQNVGRIDAAWRAFVDAVRDGDGAAILARWRDYRITRRLVTDAFRAFAGHERERQTAAIRAERERWGALVTECGLLDTWPSSQRGAEYAERLAAYNKARAEALGLSGYDPAARPKDDIPEPPRLPSGSIGGPEPREGESFDAALGKAMDIVEREAVAAQRDERRAALAAYVEQEGNR